MHNKHDREVHGVYVHNQFSLYHRRFAMLVCICMSAAVDSAEILLWCSILTLDAHPAQHPTVSPPARAISSFTSWETTRESEARLRLHVLAMAERLETWRTGKGSL